MPVRKAVTRSGKHFRAKFPSRKLGQMVLVESILEGHAALILEHRKDVATFEAQPSIETYYDAQGAAHEYVPDFLATLVDGNTITIEVKPAAKLLNPVLRAKFDSIAQRFKETDRRFEIWTEDVIRAEPRFSQFRQMQRAQVKRLETKPLREVTELPTQTPTAEATQQPDRAPQSADPKGPLPATELVRLFEREELVWLVNFGESEE